MASIFAFAAHTANILGIFTDPFEFEGDYGQEVNPIRRKVFEQVVSKEALARYHTGDIVAAKQWDKEHGPTFGELMTPQLWQELKQKQELLFSEEEFENFVCFVGRHKDERAFFFFRQLLPELLLDKALRDQFARVGGEGFNPPILGSTRLLAGQEVDALKKALLDALFTEKVFACAKPSDVFQSYVAKMASVLAAEELPAPQELEIFATPAGQTFLYWMYQSLNLQLVAKNAEQIDAINKVKQIFARTLGDPHARATMLKEKLRAAQSSVLFTQESDSEVAQELTKDGEYLPVNEQKQKDGTWIFLRATEWESAVELIPVEGYEGYENGRLTLVLARHRETGLPFLLVAGHGHSTQAEDGRLQIEIVKKKFDELALEHKGLQLLIGIDANTKSAKDVQLFQEQLEKLGLVSTHVGPTTIKQRMVTAQHAKSGRPARDEEDYLITLKPENGGLFYLDHQTVGFKEGPADSNQSLPNLENPSDHYAVGASLTRTVSKS